MHYRWIRTFLGVLFTIVMLVPVVNGNRFLLIDRFEYDLYDLRINRFAQNDIDPRIVIVDIDDKSLAEQGRWPWARSTIADLMDALFDDYETVLVGFDMVFAESDTRVEISQVESILKRHQANKEMIDTDVLINEINPDQRLANAISERLVVLGFLFDSSSSAQKAGVPGTPVISDKSLLEATQIPETVGIISSIETLQRESISAGFFDNPKVDPDGVYRRVPLLQRYQGEYYPSLPLAMMMTLFGESEVQPVVERDSKGELSVLVAVEVAGYPIPVDEQGSVLVPYRGPQGSFPYVSATDVLKGSVDPAILDGAIVLIGTSAAGLLDLRVTPIDSRYAGVEVHANILSGMLDERFLHQPDYTRGVEFFQLALSGILLSILIPLTSVMVASAATLAWIATLVGFNFYAWTELSWVIPLGYTLVLTVSLFLVLQISGYFFESRRTAQLTTKFGQYVPPEVVKELSDQGKEVSLSGESRDLTVFFSDIRGFTSLSEGLTPKQLTRLMNVYLTEMTEVIHQHRGTIDKYIGDALMAFWGAPITDELHAENAIKAALAMQSRLGAVNRLLLKEGLPAISMGMGINSGSMNVGNMGSSFRMAYTVLGDAVNLGARLEGLTKFYGCSLIVSDQVKKRAPDFFYRTLDLVRVKGRIEPVEIFQPLGTIDQLSEIELASWVLYESGIQSYRDRDWMGAKEAFAAFLIAKPEDTLALIYNERIALFEGHQTIEDWSPVYNHLEK